MKRVLLILLLFLPLSLFAQSLPPIIRLTEDSFLEKREIRFAENWLFHSGDDSSWAAKGFNDTDWKKNVDPLMNVGMDYDKEIGFTGIGWFRIHFHTDSTLMKYLLALKIMQYGASEIYLDGKLLTSYGSFSKEGMHTYVNPKMKPFTFLISDTGNHVFAVKYENFDARKMFEKKGEGKAGFIFVVADFDWANDYYNGSQKAQTALMLSSASIFFALFLVHLMLFMFYKADKSNLYFSLFNFAVAAFILLMFVGMISQGVVFSSFIFQWVYVALGLACMAISLFINKLFGNSLLRSRIIVGLCIIEMVLPFIHFSFASYYLSFLAILCAAEAVILLSVAMYKNIGGSRIIGIGILFFVLFLVTIIIVTLVSGGLKTDESILGTLIDLLIVLGVFSIPFSLSAYLAWNFATVNKRLGEQLRQVEQLSQDALLHEQEKQKLLEYRRDELEQEVALRTTEVMHQKNQIELQHEALKSEKKKSDELLLNILPVEVAEELKENGQSKAQLFDDVTVLFTDFVNFTQISERLGAEELVAELHECFRAFDAIMDLHHLEKIKTIGDAYLAVSGMPVYNDQHARNAVKAGLDIIEFVRQRNKKKDTFEIRIGIHSGPLVAGIVGVKKFAYDIWGDTVNMASRMETNSEAGKINISAQTHELVKHDFQFTYRGKIEAKNKGKVDMYFVEDLSKKSSYY